MQVLRIVIVIIRCRFLLLNMMSLKTLNVGIALLYLVHQMYRCTNSYNSNITGTCICKLKRQMTVFVGVCQDFQEGHLEVQDIQE